MLVILILLTHSIKGTLYISFSKLKALNSLFNTPFVTVRRFVIFGRKAATRLVPCVGGSFLLSSRVGGRFGGNVTVEFSRRRNLPLPSCCRISVRVAPFAPLPSNVGVCYGTLGDNLPPPGEVVALMQKCNILKLRLYDPNPDVLAALRGSDLLVSYGVKNEDLAAVASGVDQAQSWVDQFYVPYQQLNIAEIVVGNEAVPGDLSGHVVPAMRNLHAAFQNSNFSMTITTAISSAALTDTYPPSHSAFTNGAIDVMTDLVNFFKYSGIPRSMLYVHLYPYFAYAADPVNVGRDYALFEAQEPVVVDGNLTYYNLFDAMYDGFLWAMEKIGGGGAVQLVVGETGWPSAGNGEFTTPALAQTYVTNMYRHVVDDDRTPKNPNGGLGGVVAFSLFNEDGKPAGVDQNFGLYYPYMQPVYSSPFSC